MRLLREPSRLGSQNEARKHLIVRSIGGRDRSRLAKFEFGVWSLEFESETKDKRLVLLPFDGPLTRKLSEQPHGNCEPGQRTLRLRLQTANSP
jgi:hypothetical protein